jgi:tight adherence protein C
MANWTLYAGLLGLFAGLAVAISMAGIIGKERSQVSASLEAIEAISGPIPEDMRSAYDQPFADRVGRPAQRRLARIGRTLSGSQWATTTNRRIEMAGSPPGWDAERILASKTMVALLAATVAAGILYLADRSALQSLLWGAVFGIGGFFLPDLVLVNKGKSRAHSIRRALPDSIDLLTVSVESGLAFDASMAQVAHNTEGPLADEFSRVLKEIQIGSGRSEALKALAARTDVEDLRVFLNSMVQADKLGIPIADVLRVQAAEIRLKRSQRIEEQAMKLPVKLVFPLLFGIMPSMFIVILGPAIISIYETLIA